MLSLVFLYNEPGFNYKTGIHSPAIENMVFRIQKNILLLTVSILLVGLTDAHARDRISIDLSGTALSRFVWRGDMWTDDPVFWNIATVHYKGFRSYNFFNIDLTDINDDKFQCNEYDYILDYTFSFDTFSIAPGVLHFTSPTDYFEPTTKITLQIKTNLPLNTGLRIRVDPEKSRGSYYIFDISQRFSLKKPIYQIDFYGSLGASQPRYYGKGLKDKIAFTDILLGIGIPFDIGKGMTLTPLVEFTALLGHHLRNGIKATGRKMETFIFGITLAKGFEF